LFTGGSFSGEENGKGATKASEGGRETN